MNEPTLFGISNANWEVINGFANWFAAIGSIAAAVVALYLANRSNKPSAKVSVGHRIIVGPGSKKPYPEIIVFKITNTGDRPIRVVQIGWKVGLFRKQYAVQTFDEAQSSPLPVELTHSQEASWFIPLDSTDEPWFEFFSKTMILPHKRTNLLTLRANFYASIGYEFSTRPEKNLLEKLESACIEVKNNR
jgi:hypothetical protein